MKRWYPVITGALWYLWYAARYSVPVARTEGEIVPKILTVIKTEPALIAGITQAILALLAATVLTSLTTDQSGAILAATTAVAGLVAAVATRPFAVASLTGFTGAIVTLLVTFGVHGVQPGSVALINAVVVTLAALVVRMHVTPVAAQPAAPPAQ